MHILLPLSLGEGSQLRIPSVVHKGTTTRVQTMVSWDLDAAEASRFRTMSLQTLPNLKKERLKQLKFGRQTNSTGDIQVSVTARRHLGLEGGRTSTP
jgi:hypothetical protein